MSEVRPFLFRCTACGAKNKIPAEKLKQQPRCGKCGGGLDTGALFLPQPVVVTGANFEEVVLKSPIPVLLDCWAEWCGPCRAFTPVVQELGHIMQQRVRVAKLNVDQHPEISGRYDILGLPTCLVFDGGEVRERFTGAIDKHAALLAMGKYT